MKQPKNLVLTDKDKESIIQLSRTKEQLREKLKKRIVGLDEAIDQILIAVFSGSHALLVGVPGLAKTLMIRSIAELLDLKFSRIQFTPDLMPSDITGTEILTVDQTDLSRKFTFLQGPIFANIILADEINRTPPKTQSALLEAMEEKTVTSTGRRFELEPPFFVLATQNPIDQEGTYPLPVAQLDRFMFNILFDYPSEEEEKRIMRMTISKPLEELKPLLSRDEILHFLAIVRNIAIAPEVMQYALSLSRLSRPTEAKAPKMVKESLSWGASPRAAQALILGAKARAMLQGNLFVTAEDIRAILHPILRHRIILNYKAEADGVTPDEIVDEIMIKTPAPDGSVKLQRSKHHSQKLYLSMLNR